MPSKALVVDANILIQAVLGKRVREVLHTHCGEVSFFVPLMPRPPNTSRFLSRNMAAIRRRRSLYCEP